MKDKDYIAIYPEMITSPNPFGAKHIVYYICNKPGLLGGIKEYPPDSIKVWYGAFLDPPPADIKLTIPTIELDLFNLSGMGRRFISSSWVGKAGLLGLFKGVPEGNKHITYRWPKRRIDLANLLKMSKVLYSYDVCTALTMEAALCGCPSMIMLDEPFTKSEIEKNEFGTAGICWRKEDLNQAIKTLPMALPNYLKVENNMKNQLSKFIEVTQAM